MRIADKSIPESRLYVIFSCLSQRASPPLALSVHRRPPSGQGNLVGGSKREETAAPCITQVSSGAHFQHVGEPDPLNRAVGSIKIWKRLDVIGVNFAYMLVDATEEPLCPVPRC